MLTLIVEAVLGILLAVVLMNFFKHRSTPPPSAPQQDLANLKPTDARTGDVISLAGAGDDMTDLDFTSDRTTWIQAGGRNWFEVSGPYRERRVSMRVSNEEEIEVAIHSDPRKLSPEDIGVSEADLGEMDERQNPSDFFEFDGKNWMYRQSVEVQAKRDDQPQPASYYYWEFREQDGKGILAIRKPQGEPFVIQLFAGIPASDVTIYRRA